MSSAHMKLVAFRVTNFRSVQDSGWIDTDDVTSLIGTNESGKTNLLVPLWKLNPAKEGDIKLLADAPRKQYNAYRGMKTKPVFIRARFILSDALSGQIANKVGLHADMVRNVEVSRNLDGEYSFNFPDATSSRLIAKLDIESILLLAQNDIDKMQPVDEADARLKTTILELFTSLMERLNSSSERIGLADASSFHSSLGELDLKTPSPQSTIAPRFRQATKAVAKLVHNMDKTGPNDSSEIRKLVKDNLPSFVYYSTYGNLDSEIYLPHVIEDLKRTELTGRAEARARTLRVLFSFVRLKPEEILELGKDWNEQQQGKPSDAQIQSLNDKKKERSVLLQSAGTELTTRFRDWWKQGEYRMRFEADGNHFRIWVSDDKRPEEIELEGRSTGLQWFLSFYLVFLVESAAAHNGAILLLDEPGLSLHPIAQRDLALFFENLSKSNQLLYTTHSPFLVDADHLDRVRAVYVDSQGHTTVSTNLRAGQTAAESKSIYPVHAALGLSVSDTLFQGCRPTVVEGPSDQLYLSAIKNALVGMGKLRPSRELLFVPTSGVKAIKTVATILGGKDENLPLVLCDGDSAGKALAKLLRAEMYKDIADRVLLVSDFTASDDTQIEDLFPRFFLTPIIDRYLKGPDDQPFTPSSTNPSIIDEVKSYAVSHGISLAEGWKVELARMVKVRITTELVQSADWTATVAVWEKLFHRLSEEKAGPKLAKATATADARG